MSGDSTNLKKEFTTELESILESDEAYGSNIQVLTYALKEDVINGKFKDSWNNRVYEFIIDKDGINYKPAAKLDSFGADEAPLRFDAYSEGYSSLFVDVRSDGKLTGKRTKKPKCGVTAYGCGFSCIGLIKTCKILSTGTKAGSYEQGKAIGKERLTKLIARANALDPTQQAATVMQLKSTAKGVESARNRYTSKGKAREYERAWAKQSEVKTATKPQEKQPAKPKSEPVKLADNPKANPNSLTVDQEIFKTKFPSKEIQREYGLGGVIDRAKSTIDFIENPKTFNRMPVNEQAGVLDNLTTVHGVSDKNWDERLKMPMIANNEERRMGAEAANIRAQGSKQIWDNLDDKEKTTLAKKLKELGSALVDESDTFENRYVAQLASEIRKLNK